MRGKGFVVGFLLGGVRITPAYAGKSQPVQAAERAAWDHPRLCGEKLPHHVHQDPVIGSPPPMRGKD